MRPVAFICVFFLAVLQNARGVDYQQACISSNFNKIAGISEGIFCVQIPTNELPSTVKALKVRGEIRSLRKELFEPNKHIRNLDLSYCDVSEIGPMVLSPLKDLQVLTLSNNSIDFITEDSFRDLHLLEELYLDGNGMKVIMDDSFKNQKVLKILNLANNKLLEMPGDLPSTLIELNVMNNEIERLSMEKLSNLINLETLQACGNDINNWPEGDLFPELKNLCIGDKVILSTAKSSNLPRIESLHLSAGRLNSPVLSETLTDRISALPTLQRVALENYEVESFGFLTNITHLTSLNLQNISYTAEEARTFPSNLTVLTINGSPDLANSLLRTSSFSLQLKKLSLKNNNIQVISTNQSDHLMVNLESLDISSNPINCVTEEWGWLCKKIKSNNEFLKDPENAICHEPEASKNKKIFEVLDLKNCIYNIPHEIKESNFDGNFTVYKNKTLDETDLLYGVIIFFSTVIPFIVIFSICTAIVNKYGVNILKEMEEREIRPNPPDISNGNLETASNINEPQKAGQIISSTEDVKENNCNIDNSYPKETCKQSCTAVNCDVEHTNQNQMFTNTCTATIEECK